MKTDKLVDRYDFTIGFVALVVSLSAFKDELKTISFTLGTLNYNLGQYFLVVICGFLVCLYFYSIEKISRNYSFGRKKLFSIILIIAEVLFIFIVISPVILLFAHFGFWIYSAMPEIPNEKQNTVSPIFQVMTFVINIFVAVLFFILYNKQRKEIKLKELGEEEMMGLNLADRLLKDGLYSQSIMESFKVFETHLYKHLTKKNIRVSRNRLNDLIEASLEYDILSSDDLPQLYEIRDMKNSVAHLDINCSKEDAEMAFKFIKELIINTAAKSKTPGK